ncbi:PREDICTED: receptor-transporting protein 3-like [Merops nubicus]|uniref:receptor-transporting protein 3-like n=1 Tax=Merops nubicus TaxID=57421 RepID=UPI0004F05ADC|nr:PREDICTED: receptor-transporting protein 3-like [Merops nubicus]
MAVRWGTVWMRAFRQACRRCSDPRLEEPDFSQDTMEKLLHNLVLKILKYFYHVPIQASDLLEVVVDVVVSGPHDSARCEGCQLGVCSRARLAQQPSMDVDKARSSHTPKRWGTRSRVTPSCDRSPGNSTFSWKRWCCIGSSLLCALAVLLFLLLYFTKY